MNNADPTSWVNKSNNTVLLLCRVLSQFEGVVIKYDKSVNIF